MTFSGSNPFLDDIFPKKPSSAKRSDPPAPFSSAPVAAVVSQPDDPKGDQKPSASNKKSSLKAHAPKEDDDIYSVESDSEAQEKLFAEAKTISASSDKTKNPKAPHSLALKRFDSLIASKEDPTGNDDELLLTEGEIGTDPDDENPPFLLRAGAYRHEFYFTHDFHKLSDKSLEYIFSELEKSAPIDWCDSFFKPLHVTLTRDPSLWSEVRSSFNRLTSTDNLHVWLTSKTKNHPFALLGLSRGGNPFLFHNLCCPENCGSFIDPQIPFYGLNRIPFESIPFQLDNDDVPLLLSDHVFSQVPTFAEILDHCVVEIDDFSPSSSFPHLTFDSSKFKSFSGVASSSSSSSKTDRDFVCSSLCLIPPCFSGLMLHNTDASTHNVNVSFEDLASGLYKVALHHWWTSSMDSTVEVKKKGMPLDYPLLMIQEPIIRFLWIVLHCRDSPKLQIVFPSIPKDPSKANSTISIHRSRVFPNLAPQARTTPSSSKRPSLRRSSSNVRFQSTSPVDCLMPPQDASPSTDQLSSQGNGVRMLDDDGNVHFVSPEMFLLSKCIKELTSKKSGNEDDITAPESKSMFRDMPLNAQKTLSLGSITSSAISLPDELSQIIKIVWKSKNSATFFESFLAEVFDPSDNACTILFGQCTVIQRLGLRWKSEACPGGFSPFSFDPYAIPGLDSNNTLDKNIRQQIHDASLFHLNVMKQSKDMQQLYSDHNLFFPRTADEFEKQLRSFWACAKGLCGSSSMIANQVLKVLNFYHKFRTKIMAKQQSSGNDFYFGQFLFAIDEAVQEFVATLSSVSSLADIGFNDFEERVNWILFNVKTGSTLVSLPPALQAKFQANQLKHSQKKRSAGSDDGPSNPKRQQNSSSSNSDPPKTPITFDSPSNWRLPSESNYMSVFPPSVLSNIPFVTKDGGKKQHFCNILFTKGICKKGKKCKFLHDDPSKHNKKEAMDEFYRSAYANANRN